MKYGCHNRKPFKKTLNVQDGWKKSDGVRQMVRQKFVMSPDCQYRHTDLGKVDSKCDGCKWRGQ